MVLPSQETEHMVIETDRPRNDMGLEGCKDLSLTLRVSQKWLEWPD